jgi:hypothetical protein
MNCLSCKFGPVWYKRYLGDPHNFYEGRCGFVSISMLRKLPPYGSVETPYLRRKGDEVFIVARHNVDVDIPFDGPCNAYRSKRKRKDGSHD